MLSAGLISHHSIHLLIITHNSIHLLLITDHNYISCRCRVGDQCLIHSEVVFSVFLGSY